MSTPSNIYWADRQAQLAAGMANEEKRLYAKFSVYYEREAARLDKEIAAFYAQYGENNIIEYRKLLQSLSDADRQLLIERIDGFAKKYPEYAHLLPVRESIYKLNRIEGLRQSIAMQQLEMGAYEQQQAQEFFTIQSQRFANGAAEMMGYGSSFYSIDSDMVKMAVGNPWCSGKNFSERIWDNRTKLTQTLQSEIVNGIIRGDDYHTTSRILQERFKAVSKNNIERLVFTENTYLQNESAMNVFASDPDFEEYTFMARKKANPCDLCKALSGKTFRIDERKPGENFPPIHPWCGCTFTIPQLDIRKVLENGRKHAAEKQKSTAIPLTDSRERGIIKAGNPLQISIQFFARIPEEKFTKYALDPERQPDKAKAFKNALGYTLENYQDLIDNIRSHLDESKMKRKAVNSYGILYEYVMRLKGPNGKEANVCTGWIIKNGETEPQLTSAYITKKGVTKDA